LIIYKNSQRERPVNSSNFLSNKSPSNSNSTHSQAKTIVPFSKCPPRVFPFLSATAMWAWIKGFPSFLDTFPTQERISTGSFIEFL